MHIQQWTQLYPQNHNLTLTSVTLSPTSSTTYGFYPYVLAEIHLTPSIIRIDYLLLTWLGIGATYDTEDSGEKTLVFERQVGPVKSSAGDWGGVGGMETIDSLLYFLYDNFLLDIFTDTLWGIIIWFNQSLFCFNRPPISWIPHFRTTPLLNHLKSYSILSTTFQLHF